MPDLLARWRRLPGSGARTGHASPESQPLAVLRLLAAELGDAEGKIDEALGRTRLPKYLLRTRAWDRNRAQLQSTPGMERLCADLETAYAEVLRIMEIRTGRLWQNYLTLPGDRVEDALARIRHALDALEVTIEMLSRRDRPTVL
jgi:hypothetical protein